MNKDYKKIIKDLEDQGKSAEAAKVYKEIMDNLFNAMSDGSKAVLEADTTLSVSNAIDKSEEDGNNDAIEVLKNIKETEDVLNS